MQWDKYRERMQKEEQNMLFAVSSNSPMKAMNQECEKLSYK